MIFMSRFEAFFAINLKTSNNRKVQVTSCKKEVLVIRKPKQMNENRVEQYKNYIFHENETIKHQNTDLTT